LWRNAPIWTSGRPVSASCSYRLTMEDIEYEDIQSSLANLESGSGSKSPPKSFRSRRMSMMGRAQMVQMQGQLPQVASPRTHARRCEPSAHTLMCTHVHTCVRARNRSQNTLLDVVGVLQSRARPTVAAVAPVNPIRSERKLTLSKKNSVGGAAWHSAIGA